MQESEAALYQGAGTIRADIELLLCDHCAQLYDNMISYQGKRQGWEGEKMSELVYCVSALK